MSRLPVSWLVSVPLALLLLTTPALPQVIRPSPNTPAPAKPPLRLEAIAETRLLMEGLADANFRGLEKTLAKKPTDAQGWTFARGQALLLAETANLLMLRPPKVQGREEWLEAVREMRDASTLLARSAAGGDYTRSRDGMDQLATACNQCHRTFRVTVRVVPFADANKRTSLPE